MSSVACNSSLASIIDPVIKINREDGVWLGEMFHYGQGLIAACAGRHARASISCRNGDKELKWNFGGLSLTRRRLAAIAPEEAVADARLAEKEHRCDEDETAYRARLK